MGSAAYYFKSQTYIQKISARIYAFRYEYLFIHFPKEGDKFLLFANKANRLKTLCYIKMLANNAFTLLASIKPGDPYGN